jgi:hypothetical protein
MHVHDLYKAVLLHVARNDVGRRGNDRNAAIARRRPDKIIPSVPGIRIFQTLSTSSGVG